MSISNGARQHHAVSTQKRMQHISLVQIEALIDEMVRFIDEDGNEQLSGKELERKLSGRILEVLHGI